MKKRGFLAIVLALSMILSLLPVNYAFAAGETGDFTVSGGTLGTDYSYSDNGFEEYKADNLRHHNCGSDCGGKRSEGKSCPQQPEHYHRLHQQQ